MTDHGTMPFTMTILILLFIVVIFAMKYAAQVYHARLEAAKSTQTDLRVATLDDQARVLETRVARLEAMLRDVE